MSTITVKQGPRSPAEGNLAAIRDHSRTGRWFAEQIAADPRLKGRVLDVGCGDSPTISHYHAMYKLPAQLDGLDPTPAVWQNTWITRKWQGEFEKCPIPEGEYDALVSINVAEHVSDPGAFLRQAFRVLKPGGRYYSLTPSGVHPFPYCVRLIQALKLKQGMVKDQDGWNDYPAYYRLNSPSALRRYGGAAGFSGLTLIRHSNMQWHQYWPRPLRFVPWTYDMLLGTRFVPLYQSLLFVLEKPGTWTGPSPRMSDAELAQWNHSNAAESPQPVGAT